MVEFFKIHGYSELIHINYLKSSIFMYLKTSFNKLSSFHKLYKKLIISSIKWPCPIYLHNCHGRPQGRARGGRWPSLVGQNSMFLTFLVENSMFLGVFQANSMFPPPGKFCPPLEKSLRTPMITVMKQNLRNRKKWMWHRKYIEKISGEVDNI